MKFIRASFLILLSSSAALLAAESQETEIPLAKTELSIEQQQNYMLEAINQIAIFTTFYDVYPEAHFLLAQTRAEEPLRAEGRALLLGRYIVSVGVDLGLSEKGDSLVPLSEPDFHLKEVERVRRAGRGVMAHEGELWTLDKKSFEKLLAANGDPDALDLPLHKDKPVRFIDRYWASMTR